MRLKRVKVLTRESLKKWLDDRYVHPENRKEETVAYNFKKYGKLIGDKKYIKARILNRIYGFQFVNFISHELFKKCSLGEMEFDDKQVGELVDDLNSFNAKVSFKGNRVIVNSEKLNVEIETFSKSRPAIKNVLPKIETTKRATHCHYNSLHTSLILKCHYKIPNDVVTGKIYTLSHKCRYLHSWVEFEENGVRMVADPTRNILMKKTEYYNLVNAKNIYKVSSEQIEQDVDFLNEIVNEKFELFLKVYLTNPQRAKKIFAQLKQNEQSQIEKIKELQ